MIILQASTGVSVVLSSQHLTAIDSPIHSDGTADHCAYTHLGICIVKSSYKSYSTRAHQFGIRCF